MEGTECPVDTMGEHSFESYVVATLPPDKDLLEVALQGHSYISEAVARIVESMTAKKYLIACSKCGLTIGDYSGVKPPNIEVEEEPVPSPV